MVLTQEWWQWTWGWWTGKQAFRSLTQPSTCLSKGRAWADGYLWKMLSKGAHNATEAKHGWVQGRAHGDTTDWGYGWAYGWRAGWDAHHTTKTNATIAHDWGCYAWGTTHWHSWVSGYRDGWESWTASDADRTTCAHKWTEALAMGKAAGWNARHASDNATLPAWTHTKFAPHNSPAKWANGWTSGWTFGWSLGWSAVNQTDCDNGWVLLTVTMHKTHGYNVQ